MIDRRLLVAICGALVALASGVLALALDAPALGLVAGTGAVVAAAAAAILTSRLRIVATQRPSVAGQPIVALDLAALEARAGDETDVRDPFDGPGSYRAHPAHGDRAEFGAGADDRLRSFGRRRDDQNPDTDDDVAPTGDLDYANDLRNDDALDIAASGPNLSVVPPADSHPASPSSAFTHPEADLPSEIAPGSVGALAEQANDPVSGLLGGPYFYAALDRGVASARRQLQPLSLVLFELDGLDDAADSDVDGSMEVLGVILRRTLRECDTACRTGRTTAAVLLEDTPETGAVWAAERVRGGLLARPGGEHLTVSAGVASYPSHALDADDLLQRAEQALTSARNQGRDRVEIARGE